MKRKFTLPLFFISVLFLSGIFSANAQLTTATVVYSGAQAAGCCNVCGLDYWCINNSGGCGTSLTCDSQLFTDPVPAGNIVTNISFTVYTSGGSGTITPSVDGTSANTMTETSGAGSCGDCSMVVSAGSPSFPCGYPGYVYGGSNTLQLCTSTDVCVQRAELAITYIPNPVPVAPTSVSVDHNNFCSGAFPNITLTASGGSGTTLHWYSGSCTGTLVGSGNPLTIAAPAVTTTYYALWSTTCGNSACANITVTITPGASPPTSAIVDHPAYCAGDYANITLSATGGSGTTLNWYSGSCNGTLVGTGTPLTIAAPSSSTTYYASWNIAGCGSSTCASTNVTVTPVPVKPISVSSNNSSFCAGAFPTITLTAVGGSGTTLSWYTGSCGSTLVGTGNPLTIPSPATTTTYYAAWSNTCGASACTSTTVTISPAPVAPASAVVDHPSFCSGDYATIALTATGGSGTTLNWYSGSCNGTLVGSGSPLTIAAPSSTTTYYASWTNGCGTSTCSNTTVTVNPVPVAPATATVDHPAFCNGDYPTITLTATGGSGTTLNWYSGSCGGTFVGTGSPLTITAPSSTTTYYASWTNSCGTTTCASTTVTLGVLAIAPTSATVDHTAFCAGTFPTITLTATGGSGTILNWYAGSCGGAFVGTGSSLTITAPLSTTTYFASWANGCGSSTCANTQVTINPAPVAPVSAIVDHPAFCAGAFPSITLTANGGSGATLNWYSGSCGGAPIGTGSPLTITAPATTTTYYASWTNGCGTSTCTNTTVTINPMPAAPTSALVDHSVFCTGAWPTITLTATGGSGNTLNWYTGSCNGTLVGSGTPLTITAPLLTTVYFASWTNGCGASTCASVNVNINPLPVANAGSDVSIPNGAWTTLNGSATGGSGSYIYSWSPAGLLNNPNIANPTTTNLSSTTTYTLTVTDQVTGCTGTDQVTVTITGPPLSAVASSNFPAVCSGSSVQLSCNAFGGSGIYTYSWSSNPAGFTSNLQNPVLIPAITAIYTVTVNDGYNNVTSSVTVTVNPIPFANAGPDVSICNGASTSLNATGGTIYAWSPAMGLSAANIPNPIASPAASTTYVVTVTNVNGCSATDNVIISLYNTIPANAGADHTICAGSSAYLSGSGGVNFNWSPPAGLNSTTVPNPIATPVSTTTYTLVTTDNNGCTSADNVVVNVNPNVVPFAGSDVSICNGNSTALTASGGTIYAWSPSYGLNVTNSATPVASPLLTTIYTVTVSNSFGCSGTDNVTVIVNPLPIANAGPDNSLCSGNSVTLNATGGTIYSWSPGTDLSATNIPNPIASPLSSITYTVVVSNISGCSASDNVLITVNATPMADAGTSPTICNHQSTVLTATGGTNYIWNNGVNSDTNPVAPNNSTTYVVTVSNSFGCSATDMVTVDVLPFEPPVVTASGPLIFCNNDPINVTLDAGAAYSTYLWSSGESTQTINVTAAGSFYVIAAYANGCSDTSNIVNVTNPSPINPLIQADGTTDFCEGEHISVTLSTAIPYYTYAWTSGSHTRDILVTAAGSYSVTVTDSSGCSAVSNTIDVHFIPKPVAYMNYNAGGTYATFFDASLYGMTYHWDFGDGATSLQQDPTHTYPGPGVYPVTFIVFNDCGSDTVNVYITIVSGAGIDEFSSVENLLIYPIPTNDQLDVSFDLASSKTLEVNILNTLGQLLYNESIIGFSGKYHKTFSLATYAVGMYYLQIHSDSGIMSRKFIVN